MSVSQTSLSTANPVPKSCRRVCNNGFVNIKSCMQPLRQTSLPIVKLHMHRMTQCCKHTIPQHKPIRKIPRSLPALLTKYHLFPSAQPTHLLTTSSTPATPFLLASTSNHSLCSFPQLSQSFFTLLSPSSIWTSRSTRCACGTFRGVSGGVSDGFSDCDGESFEGVGGADGDEGR